MLENKSRLAINKTDFFKPGGFFIFSMSYKFVYNVQRKNLCMLYNLHLYLADIHI